MVSMLHRNAESAKKNRIAAERLLSGVIEGERKAHKQDTPAREPAVVQPDAPMTERQASPDEGLLYFGRIPKGTAEGLLLAECTKYGNITSLYYDAQLADAIEGAWALVK